MTVPTERDTGLRMVRFSIRNPVRMSDLRKRLSAGVEKGADLLHPSPPPRQVSGHTDRWHGFDTPGVGDIVRMTICDCQAIERLQNGFHLTAAGTATGRGRSTSAPSGASRSTAAEARGRCRRGFT